jgi:hypothetical protein
MLVCCGWSQEDGGWLTRGRRLLAARPIGWIGYGYSSRTHVYGGLLQRWFKPHEKGRE